MLNFLVRNSRLIRIILLIKRGQLLDSIVYAIKRPVFTYLMIVRLRRRLLYRNLHRPYKKNDVLDRAINRVRVKRLPVVEVK